jgi:hypothetical protein
MLHGPESGHFGYSGQAALPDCSSVSPPFTRHAKAELVYNLALLNGILSTK